LPPERRTRRSPLSAIRTAASSAIFRPTGGRKIAFRSGRDGNLEIYVMNADGSEQQRLTRNPARSVQFLAWSPAQKK
jgi:Tol biopolymer transport system component